MGETDDLTKATDAAREAMTHGLNVGDENLDAMPEDVARAVLDAVGWSPELSQPLPASDPDNPSCHVLLASVLDALSEHAGGRRREALQYLAGLNEGRASFGWRKYRSILRPFNGRHPIKEVLAEHLDALVYLTQELHEVGVREGPTSPGAQAARAWRSDLIEQAAAIVDRSDLLPTSNGVPTS